MQHELLSLLRCPLTKKPLQFQLISSFQKEYQGHTIEEIKEGLLFSEAGFIFPIIDGIPRLLIESMYDYKKFLQNHLPDYEDRIKQLEKDHLDLLIYCKQKNTKTKESFELEWSFLDQQNNEKVWRDSEAGLPEVYFSETNSSPESLKDKNVIDVGCGHGLMTRFIASHAKIAVGVEISKAVENAYLYNKIANAWYIQADLQYLPFEEAFFDEIYCSGVLHHTNDTEKSLSLIEPVLKPSGKICLWLYHPQKSKLHHLILTGWKFFKSLPLKLAYWLLLLFVFPFTYTLKKIRNKRSFTWREEMIDLLDQFTPDYRFEITHEEAKHWLEKRKYAAIQITTTNQFGFSITGIKH